MELCRHPTTRVAIEEAGVLPLTFLLCLHPFRPALPGLWTRIQLDHGGCCSLVTTIFIHQFLMTRECISISTGCNGEAESPTEWLYAASRRQ